MDQARADLLQPLAPEGLDPVSPWVAALFGDEVERRLAAASGPPPPALGPALWRLAVTRPWEVQCFLLEQEVPGLEEVEGRPEMQMISLRRRARAGEALSSEIALQLADRGAWVDLRRWQQDLGQSVPRPAMVRWMSAVGWAPSATELLRVASWQKAFHETWQGLVAPGFWRAAVAPFDFEALLPLLSPAASGERAEFAQCASLIQDYAQEHDYRGRAAQVAPADSEAWAVFLQLQELDRKIRPANPGKASRTRV